MGHNRPILVDGAQDSLLDSIYIPNRASDATRVIR